MVDGEEDLVGRGLSESGPRGGDVQGRGDSEESLREGLTSLVTGTFSPDSFWGLWKVVHYRVVLPW